MRLIQEICSVPLPTEHPAPKAAIHEPEPDNLMAELGEDKEVQELLLRKITAEGAQPQAAHGALEELRHPDPAGLERPGDQTAAAADATCDFHEAWIGGASTAALAAVACSSGSIRDSARRCEKTTGRNREKRILVHEIHQDTQKTKTF